MVGIKIEKALNLIASIITILNVFIALPQFINPNLAIITYTFFANTNIFLKLCLILILESALSYIVGSIIRYIKKYKYLAYLIMTLIIIITTTVTFFNIEILLICKPIILDFNNPENIFKYFFLYSFFGLLSIGFLWMHADFEFDIDDKRELSVACYMVIITYFLFYISLFFR